jgi:hypothetical protein
MMPNDKIAEELLMEIEHLASFRHPDLVMFLGTLPDRQATHGILMY